MHVDGLRQRSALLQAAEEDDAGPARQVPRLRRRPGRLEAAAPPRQGRCRTHFPSAAARGDPPPLLPPPSRRGRVAPCPAQGPHWVEKARRATAYAKILHAARPTSRIDIHLAVFAEPFLSMVLSGRKTIESRFSRNRCAPYGEIGDGDIVLIKEVAGPIRGLALARRTWCYELVTEPIDRIRYRFGPGIGGDDEFWASRADAHYATLIKFDKPAAIAPVACDKRDRHGWVSLRSRQMTFHFASACFSVSPARSAAVSRPSALQLLRHSAGAERASETTCGARSPGSAATRMTANRCRTTFVRRGSTRIRWRFVETFYHLPGFSPATTLLSTAFAGTTPRWRASSTPSRPSGSTTGSTPPATSPGAIGSTPSRASTIHAHCTQPWATSAQPTPSVERLNPVHFFGGGSASGAAKARTRTYWNKLKGLMPCIGRRACGILGFETVSSGEKRHATVRKPWTVTFSASIRIFIQRPLVTGTGWLGARCGVTMLPTLGSVNRVRVQLAGRSQ